MELNKESVNEEQEEVIIDWPDLDFGDAPETDKDTQTDEGSEADTDKNADEKNEQEAGTAEPAKAPDNQGGFKLSGPWLYGLLIALAVVAAYVASQVIRKRKSAEETTAIDVAEGKTVPEVVSNGSIRAGAMEAVGARDDQQDSHGLSALNDSSKGVMAVVADGMGGLSNGKLVSSTLVRSFLEAFQAAPQSQTPQEFLLETAVRANAQINQMLRGAQRSGSTLVSAVVRNGYLHFLTVGDSRIYLYRGGALLQLNREHIYQEELAVKAVNRQIGVAQVTTDRQAHALTSYFGIGTIPHLDRNDIGVKLVSGDKILLASDGVFGTLSQAQMEQALRLSPDEAVQQMKDLILKANRPYQDNNTAVVLEYQ